jgi:glycosyltransferase involved in cell wall biosynthesis
MKPPLMTVLMPVFNTERYLAEAIDSILNQTLSDFEFIIIDDGSTDSSPAIVQSYADSRIRYYRNPENSGISATLNWGIELATTNLIARMDADDISYPARLSEQYRYMTAHPDCALLACWVRIIDEDKQVIGFDKPESGSHFYNIAFISPVYHPTVVYRRDAVLQVGGYQEKYAEDYALFWALSRKYRMHNLPQVLLDYRITRQSLHKVLRRDEYEQAHKAQVLSHLRYYMGESFQIRDSHLACLTNDFWPLLQENSVDSIIECLNTLQAINQKILSDDNVNLDRETVSVAALYKRDHILTFFAIHLPSPLNYLLLFKTGSWRLIKKLILSGESVTY